MIQLGLWGQAETLHELPERGERRAHRWERRERASETPLEALWDDFGAEDEGRDLARLKPRQRGDCEGARRAVYEALPEDDPVRAVAPCPWLSCRYHLHRDGGQLRVDADLRWTCALDVADERARSDFEIGAVMGLTEESVRLVRIRAKKKVAAALR